jgi:hypothetical protein
LVVYEGPIQAALTFVVLYPGHRTLLHASLPDGSSPGKRYLLAAAAVANQLLVYGGLNEGQGDVWAYDLKVSKGWSTNRLYRCHRMVPQ